MNHSTNNLIFEDKRLDFNVSSTFLITHHTPLLYPPLSPSIPKTIIFY
jgi:hypothetical protein